MKDSIVQHLERHLGDLDSGWRCPESAGGLKVVRFRGMPCEDATTYVTLGLSERVLPLRDDKGVRQELLLPAYDRFPPEQIASFLITFAEYIASKKQALLRGDVVGPSDPLIPGATVNAVYAAIPVLFDDDFATFHGTTPPTVFVWALPVLEKEARYIAEHGWSPFEDALESADPDLLDLGRPSIL